MRDDDLLRNNLDVDSLPQTTRFQTEKCISLQFDLCSGLQSFVNLKTRVFRIFCFHARNIHFCLRKQVEIGRKQMEKRLVSKRYGIPYSVDEVLVIDPQTAST